MKKIFLILFALLLMALQCEEDPIYENIYKIQNNSSYDLIFITDDGLMLDPRDSLTWDDFHTEFYKKINEEKVAARQEKREWQIFEDTEPAQLLGDHMQHSFRTPGCIEEARKVALDLEDCCGFVHWNGQYFFKRRENNDGLPEMIEHDNKKITFHYVAPPSSNVSNSTLSRNSNEEQVPLAIFFFLKSWLKVPEHMMTNSMSMASSAQMGMASSGMLAQHFPVEHVPAPQVPGICVQFLFSMISYFSFSSTIIFQKK